DTREPGGAATQDIGRDGNRLDVVDGARTAVKTDVGRKRRLEPRHAFLAFKAFQQRGFLAANVSARTMMHDDVEVVARAAGVLADQPCLVSLIDGCLQPL